jgi:hypothetical protein
MGENNEQKKALEELVAASYLILTESNGLDDNAWRLKDGREMQAEWPMASFNGAIKLIGKAYSSGMSALNWTDKELDEKIDEMCKKAFS